MEQNSFLFASATIAELTDLSNQVRQAIVKAALADDYLSAETQAIETTVSQMMSGMNKPRSKALTQQLEQADGSRDRLFKALVFLLRGLIFWENDPRSEAAEKLYDVIKVHGTALTRMSYEKQNAHMDALKQAMQAPEMVQAFADAGLTELWDETMAAHDNFTSMYRESASLEAAKGAIASATSLRGTLYEQLKRLMEYLSVMSRVNAAVYGALQAEVSELAHTLNTKIQIRLGHRTANNTGDETSENTEII
ncbi:MAG: DUF6261 family protein [Salinivirgaceae bacterium]